MGKMTKKMLPKVLSVAVLVAMGLTLLISGCSEKGGGNRRVPIPPDTFISFGPKEASSTYFKVQAFWYGADTDGDIEYFEVTTVKNIYEAGLDTLDYEDLQWGRTVSRESTFVFESDSCCIPEGEVEYAIAPWGIIVRAVDNEGEVDDSPASLFFTATNVLPKVRVVIPEKLPIEFLDVPPHPYIEWQGEDPDGEATGLMYKYILIPERDMNPSYPRLPPLDDTCSVDECPGYGAPPVGKWSRWVPADCTFVKDLDLSVYASLGTDYLIRAYVTVKDEGDAWLPENLYRSYNNGSNWLSLLIISQGTGVRIVIDGSTLGRRFSNDKANYETNIAGVFRGTEIAFRFWGDEERARGEIAEAYRYYYDSPDAPGSAWNYWTSTEPIRQRGSSPEWMVRYPVDGSSFVPDLGRHVFVVEVEDVNKQISHCEFNLEVLEGPIAAPERKILVVEDTEGAYLGQAWEALDDSLRSQWSRILQGYNWEWFSTGNTYREDIPVRLVGLSTTVIWLVDEDIDQNTHLLEVCTDLGNYLYSYVKVGGNLIIAGRDPFYACAYWPDGEVINPDHRATMTGANFEPRLPETAGGDTIYNFNWEIFGIKRMLQFSSGYEYNALWPCSDCWQDTIEALPADAFNSDWPGDFGGGFYITQTRSLDDTNWPGLEVQPLFSTAYHLPSGEWDVNATNAHVGVYTPAAGERGHAALIGVPTYWFDHGKIKTLIRDLLEKFGEQPLGS
jgi:hypothetical protein